MGQMTDGTRVDQASAGIAKGLRPKAEDAAEPSLGHQARDVATQITTQATALVVKKVTKGQQQSALELNGIAEMLRQRGEGMEDSVLGPMVGKAAEQLDRASEFLMDANLKDVVRSTETFARREPLLFLGGAFTLGLLCARFFKSSSQHAEDDVSPGLKRGAPVRS